ncbi:MAG TPA: agmatinase [Dehalococcoidia bacterium]|nr:agmatinase [Dehalococcoidia bacterium]
MLPDKSSNMFLGMDYSHLETIVPDCVIVPIPYDSTVSFNTGSRHSPKAIIQASIELEDYDWETGVNFADYVIWTTAPIDADMRGPEYMLSKIKTVINDLISQNCLIGLIGGEHSISVGGAQAFSENFDDFSVLYLDAHADLRDEYMGTKWGHASGARRICEFSDLVIAGIRSISLDELEFARMTGIPMLFWDRNVNLENFVAEILGKLNTNVYLSLDLDVLDPSVTGTVGNPEPGGMTWMDIVFILGEISKYRNIVGFDLSELIPDGNNTSGIYAASKLIYKIMGNSIAKKST